MDAAGDAAGVARRRHVRRFRRDYIRVDDTVTHKHGPGGEHEHGDVAFTTWLDPELATRQAAAVRDELIRLRPDRQQSFDAEFENLQAEMTAMDDGFRAVSAMLGGQPLLFSHPVYQYFESRYALNARSLHWEPDRSLSAAEVDDLNEMRASHPGHDDDLGDPSRCPRRARGWPNSA